MHPKKYGIEMKVIKTSESHGKNAKDEDTDEYKMEFQSRDKSGKLVISAASPTWFEEQMGIPFARARGYQVLVSSGPVNDTLDAYPDEVQEMVRQSARELKGLGVEKIEVSKGT
jgi:hypothetical protein